MESKSVDDMRIPIRNIWLLILFASKLYEQYYDLPKHYHTGSIEECFEDVVAFVANLLINATERRLRRELNHHFERKTAELTRVRGKINLLSTERRKLLQKGRVSCRYSSLSVNTKNNRYAKTALEKAYQLLSNQKRISDHEENIAQKCSSLAVKMELLGVVGPKPELTSERELLIHRHDRDERLMYFAASLIHELDIPAHDSHHFWQWSKPDNKLLSDLFEKAIAGFYDVRLRATPWKVKRQTRHEWPVSIETSGINDWLPIMKTDLVLDNSSTRHQIIIDTKIEEILKKNQFDELKFNNKNIFQIYSYIKTQHNSYDSSIQRMDGLLLHPAVNRTIDEHALIQGHLIRFKTVDLNQPAATIQQELLSIIERWPPVERV